MLRDEVRYRLIQYEQAPAVAFRDMGEQAIPETVAISRLSRTDRATRSG
jgi:hypothetical protein